MINCALLNTCVLNANTPLWVKFDSSSLHEGKTHKPDLIRHNLNLITHFNRVIQLLLKIRQSGKCFSQLYVLFAIKTFSKIKQNAPRMATQGATTSAFILGALARVFLS